MKVFVRIIHPQIGTFKSHFSKQARENATELCFLQSKRLFSYLSKTNKVTTILFSPIWATIHNIKN